MSLEHSNSNSNSKEVFPFHAQDVRTSNHWADRTAQTVVQVKGDKDIYVLASGITPSGVVHIGNFRELIVVELVERALKALGKKTHFIFSWDNFDPFRKVPSNFPERTHKGVPFASYLFLPLREVPDPNGKYPSYAERNEIEMEQSIQHVGVKPHFIYQSEQYKQGTYTEALREGLQKREKIRAILDQHRTTALPEDWYPVTVFCPTCLKNQLKILTYDEAYTFTYDCETCKCEREINFKTTPLVKFLWRIDWPMRWRHEKVDFEPGGKDHSSEGGSYDTAREIAKEIWGIQPPFYLQYDFVLTKGAKGEKSKMSSSVGNVLTVDELLNVYEPDMVRFLYAGQKPNVDFSIALDKDVIKNYEAFDRLEREYYGGAGVLPLKKNMAVKRLYELSCVNPPEEKAFHIPFRAAFRHLTSVIQIHDFDADAVVAQYSSEFTDKEKDEVLLRRRIQCASYWLKNYAEDEFCFSIRTESLTVADLMTDTPPALSEAFLGAYAELKKSLSDNSFWNTLDEKALFEHLYTLMSEFKIENSYFFEKMYRILIGKPKGPRLTSFILTLGQARVLELLTKLKE